MLKRWFSWFRVAAHEAGPVGMILFSLGVLAVAAVLYFGAPEAYEQVDKDPPAIPEELVDHQERGGLDRGNSLGATPAQPLPRPDALLAGLGIPYEWKGSPNWSGRGSCGPEAVIIHVTGPGSMAGMASWFNNPSSQVSAHFGIGKKGEVQQYVSLENAAWQAGVLNRPNLDNPLIANWNRNSINPNRCSIGIELLLGGPAEPLQDFPAMKASLEALLPWILTTTGIPSDRTHILGHYEVDSINRATDPRCCVSLDGLVTSIAGPPPIASDWGELDCSWGGAWHIPSKLWMGPNTVLFNPYTGLWTAPPACGF